MNNLQPNFCRISRASTLNSTGLVKKVWGFQDALRPADSAGEPFQEHPSIKTPVPGVYFASMSQVYPWDGERTSRWKLPARG
jgi:hypothetical protein